MEVKEKTKLERSSSSSKEKILFLTELHTLTLSLGVHPQRL